MRRTSAFFAIVAALAACPTEPPDAHHEDTTSAPVVTSEPSMPASTTGGASTSATSNATSVAVDASTVASDESTSDASSSSSSSSSTAEAGSTASSGSTEAVAMSTGGGVEGATLRWALNSGALTPEIGGRNAPPGFDLCPFDHVLVGLKAWLDVDPDGVRDRAPMGIAGLCAHPFVDQGTLVFEPSTTLTRHGVATAEETEVEVRCPEGHVVVGLGGRVGTYRTRDEPDSPLVDFLDAFTLSCAVVTGIDNEIRFGTPIDLDPVGRVDDPDLRNVAPHRCESGMIARGLHVYSGLWIDALALWCSSPRYTVQDGLACAAALDCTSGLCIDDVCAPEACPGECTCAGYEGRRYAFCDPVGDDYDDSIDHCAQSDLTLAQVDDGVEHSWIVSTGNVLAYEVLRLGGEDRDVEGTWHWPDGATFWTEGPVVDRFAAWAEGQPDNAGESGEDCLEVLPEGTWNDHICDESIPFVCEGAPG